VPQVMVQQQVAVGIQESRTDPWNSQKYYVDNLIIGLTLALVSQLMLTRFVGLQGFYVWVMITSQVHFLISYLFHYSVLRRTLATRAQRLAFLLTFFPMVCLFPVLYYNHSVPRDLVSYLFAVYFIMHLVRDEHVLYVQRSSGLRRFALDRALRANVVFLIVALAALVYSNYSKGISAQVETEIPHFRYAPGWTFYAFLSAVLAVGLAACRWGRRRDPGTLARGATYALLVVAGIFLFNWLLAPRISIFAFNYMIIYYHNISWYIFGIERVLHSSRAAPSAGGGAAAAHGAEPFSRFKKSPAHFMGLVLGAHLALGALYAFSWLVPLRLLDLLFNIKYMALWAFPHITMHFYPKR